MTPRPAAFAVLAAGLVLGFAAAADGTAVDEGAVRERAVALYDAGDYAGALPLLEQLDAGGLASGPDLYRLAFARASAGDREGGTEAQRRAQVALEREAAGGGTLETSFYLSNVYRNLRRAADSRRAAAEATARVEAGTLVPGDDPIDLFRVGKLYEDQGIHVQAEAWYARAVQAMAETPERYLGALRWALRHLGNLAFSRAEYTLAAERFERLVALDGTDAREWDLLATTRARLRDWPAAESAWKRSEQADPADGNRPRYCWRLAAQAAALPEVPTALPDGRAIAALTKEDLEAVLVAQAEVVREVQEALPEGGSPTEEARRDLQARLDAAHGLFVAAGLEYSVRHHPIRETAFFGGYAPLIFHANRWTLEE